MRWVLRPTERHQLRMAVAAVIILEQRHLQRNTITARENVQVGGELLGWSEDRVHESGVVFLKFIGERLGELEVFSVGKSGAVEGS